MSNNHYVDNKALFASMKEWKEELKTNPEAILPDPIAEGIIKIAQNLSRRYNFSGYTATWKEEMIGDSIEHCLRYVKNFNVDKYDNVHAYITRICFNAFVQRIKKERKETAVKYKVFLQDAMDHVEEGELDFEFCQQMLERVNDYEASKNSNKQPPVKKEPQFLEKFYK
ncbi:late sigma transcription factor [Vibrio phage D479]